MNSFLLHNYVQYWLYAMNEYSLQSPFLYDFYTNTICSKSSPSDQHEIEQIRTRLSRSQRRISTQSIGATSSISTSASRSVSGIVNGGISTRKYSSLLYRIIQKMGSKNVVELGTSLGINTLYLSSNSDVNITTFEGCSNTLAIARENFEHLARKNINCVEGNIDHTLSDFVAGQEKLDFVFFDANHRRDPTLAYFEICLRKSHEKTVFIFDDIHWSSEMEESWSQIKSSQVVTVTIDLFQFGLVFFDHHLSKEDFILSF